MVNFNNIRKIDNRQEDGFEEFVCQIASKKEIDNAKFHRLGNPDDGLECYWKYEDGSVIGWQAKFFTKNFGSSQYRQIKESIQRALKKFKLRKIIIAVPYDFPIKNNEKLNKHIVKWKNLPEAEGKNFEIEIWNKSKLISIISQQEFEGFRKFWFKELELSDEWFEANAEKALANLGDITNSDVSINTNQNMIDYIYRDNSFKNYFFENFKKLINSCKNQIRNTFINIYGHNKNDFENSFLQTYMDIIDIIENDFLRLDFDDMECLDLDPYINILFQMIDILDNFIDNLHNFEKETMPEIVNQLNKVKLSLEDLNCFFQLDEVRLTMNPYLIYTGKKGCGKTFLLSSIVKNKIKNHENIIFLRGDQFSEFKDPEITILQELGLSNHTFDEFLVALECKATIKKSRIVIFIDEIENGQGIELWNKYFTGFLRKISKLKSLGLVISIKSSYLYDVARNNPKKFNIPLDPNNITVNELDKLDEFKEYQSPIKLFESNNISFINNYLLIPEFDNPLFLKTYFELLKYGKLNNSPKTLKGYCEIIDEYLDNINDKLSYKFNYYGDNLIKKVLNRIITYKSKNRVLTKKIANKLILETLSSYPSLNYKFFNILLKEGILIERKNKIKIAFPIFEDYKITELLFKSVTKNDLKEQFEESGELYKFITINNTIRYTDFLKIFSIYIPENYGIELYELNESFKSNENILYAFLNSLKWREINNKHVLDDVKKIVSNNDALLDKLFRELIVIAPTENHIFNSYTLHEFLFNMSLTNRDTVWTTLIDEGCIQKQKFIDPILEFININDYPTYSNETTLLISILLIWLLSSIYPEFRDNISNSLIKILKNKINILLELLIMFENVNDSQIYTRLYAIGYGCATQTSDMDNLEKLALYAYENIFNKTEVYPNILLRDYAKNIIEYAINQNSNIENKIKKDKIKAPYTSKFPEIPSKNEIEILYESDNPVIKKIFKLIKGNPQLELPGEIFGCYVFTATFFMWKNYLVKDNIQISDLMNILIKRIFDLGYDIKKQGIYDESLLKYNNNGDLGIFIGGKYMWMAYYELLAQIWDRYPIPIEEFIDYEKTSKYLYPWNINIRKFDPTINHSPIKYNIDISELHKNYEKYFDDESDTHKESISFENIILPKIKVNNNDFDGILLEGNFNYLKDNAQTGEEKSVKCKIYSYTISKNQSKEFISLIKNKRLWELDFFKCKEFFEIYNKEYYCSENFDRYYQHEKNNYPKIIKIKDKNYNLNHTTSHLVFPENLFELNNYFLKIDPTIYQHCNLKYKLENSFLYSSNNNILSFDTYELDKTNHNLIFNKSAIFDYLNKNSLELFFTVEFYKNNQIYTGLYYFDDGELIGNINPYSYEIHDEILINFKGEIKEYKTSKNLGDSEYFLDKDNLITYAFSYENINDEIFNYKKIIKKNQKIDNAICSIYFLEKEHKINDKYYNFVVDSLGEYNNNYIIHIKAKYGETVLLINSSKMNITPNLKSKIFKKFIKPLLEQIDYTEFTEEPEEPDGAWDEFEYAWADTSRFV